MNSQKPSSRKIAVALCHAQPSAHESICVALNAVKGAVPEWVELIPPGTVIQGRDQRTWTITNPEELLGTSKNHASGNGAVLDLEHATHLRAGYGEPAPACGWFTDYRVAANGAIEAQVDWTDLGRGYVERREYRFISVVFDYDPESRDILVITGGGLTNNKNLRVSALNHQQPTQENEMDQKLMEALGLTPTGDQAKDLASALNAVQTLKSEKQTALNAAQNPPTDKFVPQADYQTALNRAETAEGKLQQQKEAGFKTKVETAVNHAVETGKVAPATKDYHIGSIKTEEALNAFEGTYGKAPAVVPEGTQAPTGSPESDTALNQAETEMADTFGHSAEDLKKYGGEV